MLHQHPEITLLGILWNKNVDNFTHDVCVDTMPSDYFWRRQKAATSYMDTNSTNLRIGTPHTSSAVKVMMLGSGELGKEVVIEFQR